MSTDASTPYDPEADPATADAAFSGGAGPTGDRIPEPPDALEDEGVPDLSDELGAKAVTGDAQEGFDLPQRPTTTSLDRWGVTTEEEAGLEPLERRLASEEPDLTADDIARAGEAEPVGRLEDAGTDGARALGYDGGGLTAEESALHLDPRSDPALDPLPAVAPDGEPA